jgi:hypothetical protein
MELITRQAILSQFSHKTTATEDATEEDEDTAALVELDDADLGMDSTMDGTDKADAEDGIDLSMAESDAAIVEAIATEVNNVSALPTMTRTNINLGRFAVTKVSVIMIKNNANLSVIIQLRNLAKQIFNSCTLQDDLDSC